MAKIGSVATVVVDGHSITGRVYNIRENGWPCIETPSGRIASGPEPSTKGDPVKMGDDIPTTIDLSPDYGRMREWLQVVVRTDPSYAHRVNAALGSEAADIGPALTLIDPPAPHTPCGGRTYHPSGMSCDECRPDLWGETFPNHPNA